MFYLCFWVQVKSCKDIASWTRIDCVSYANEYFDIVALLLTACLSINFCLQGNLIWTHDLATNKITVIGSIAVNTCKCHLLILQLTGADFLYLLLALVYKNCPFCHAEFLSEQISQFLCFVRLPKSPKLQRWIYCSLTCHSIKCRDTFQSFIRSLLDMSKYLSWSREDWDWFTKPSHKC